jgi:pimeloyl-ACP methyl ester carboxylesterase
MSDDSNNYQEDFIDTPTGKLQIRSSGVGEPLLVLHGELGFPGWLKYHSKLSNVYNVMAPSHPGYDKSDRIDWAMNIGDIAGFYLELLDDLKLDHIRVVGLSIGAWIAAEMAIRDPRKISKLVLVSPMGLKPDKGEIYDIYLNLAKEYLNESFYDSETVPDFKIVCPDEPSDDQLELWEVGREQSARLSWKPYMYNPTLPYLLNRLKSTDVLIISGADNRIVPVDSLNKYNDAIPGSTLKLIKECGHRVEIEKQDEFILTVKNFLE